MATPQTIQDSEYQNLREEFVSIGKNSKKELLLNQKIAKQIQITDNAEKAANKEKERLAKLLIELKDLRNSKGKDSNQNKATTNQASQNNQTLSNQGVQE